MAAYQIIPEALVPVSGHVNSGRASTGVAPGGQFLVQKNGGSLDEKTNPDHNVR
jgi:hypothetical protein